MINKHTPSPWFLHADEANNTISISNEDDDIVLFGVSCEIDDAYLIAAAPELLEALKSAVWMLTRDYIDPQKSEIIDKCEEAIAKAEGK